MIFSARIDYPSQELFTDAINTFPCIPEYAEIIFYADGINPPAVREDNGKERYLSECSRNKIAPFSVLDFEFDDKGGIFTRTSRIQGCYIINEEMGHYVEQCLNDGWRAHQCSISMGGLEDSSCAFDHLKSGLLDSFLADGYRIHGGQIWLTTRNPRRRDRSLKIKDGRCMEAGLEFGMNDFVFEEGMHLQYNPLSKTQKELRKWFGLLRRKERAVSSRMTYTTETPDSV